MTEQRPDGHEEFEELAVGWALHALEPDDEARFLRHLPGCSRCGATVEEMTETAEHLALAVPQHDPPPALKSRIMNAVSAEGSRPPATPEVREPGATVTELPDHGVPRGRHVRARSRPAFRRAGTQILAAAAMLALLAVLLVWNFQVRSDRDHSRAEAQRYREIVTQLSVPGSHLAKLATPDGTPVGTIVTDKQGTTVVSSAMPKNDTSSSVYVLWGLRGGSAAPQALGTFDITGSDLDVESVHAVGSTGRGFQQYAVSKERGRTVPKKPSQVMASGNAV